VLVCLRIENGCFLEPSGDPSIYRRAAQYDELRRDEGRKRDPDAGVVRPPGDKDPRRFGRRALLVSWGRSRSRHAPRIRARFPTRPETWLPNTAAAGDRVAELRAALGSLSVRSAYCERNRPRASNSLSGYFRNRSLFLVRVPQGGGALTASHPATLAACAPRAPSRRDSNPTTRHEPSMLGSAKKDAYHPAPASACRLRD